MLTTTLYASAHARWHRSPVGYRTGTVSPLCYYSIVNMALHNGGKLVCMLRHLLQANSFAISGGPCRIPSLQLFHIPARGVADLFSLLVSRIDYFAKIFSYLPIAAFVGVRLYASELAYRPSATFWKTDVSATSLSRGAQHPWAARVGEEFGWVRRRARFFRLLFSQPRSATRSFAFV